MLKQIKTFYAGRRPQLSDWEEAAKIAQEEDCVVDVYWLPSKWAGWYHEYVFDNSDPIELDKKIPTVYGV
jgi:hypothetical protein